MTTVAKAKQIVIDTLPECKGKPFSDVADILIDALQKKRIGLNTMVASPEFFRRFHAHCAYLGWHDRNGNGYEHWYNEAIAHAMAHEDWPRKVIVVEKEIGGEVHSIDVVIPQSTKKANNRQLLLAYSVIEDEARRQGIELPENVENDE